MRSLILVRPENIMHTAYNKAANEKADIMLGKKKICREDEAEKLL
jgi:hypothetical protein